MQCIPSKATKPPRRRSGIRPHPVPHPFTQDTTHHFGAASREPLDLPVLDEELGKVPVDILDWRVGVLLEVLPNRLSLGAVDVALGVSARSSLHPYSVAQRVYSWWGCDYIPSWRWGR